MLLDSRFIILYPLPMPNTEPFVEGVQLSINKIKLKHLFHKTVFILIIIQGLRGLYITIHDIFIVYPKLSLYYQELNFDQSVYTQMLQQVVIVSITSFIEVAFGLAMAIKKSTSVKVLHIIFGLIILLTSLYLKREGALPDFDAIEKLAFYTQIQLPSYVAFPKLL